MACTNKVCIETKRVFDACLRRYSLQNQQITVSFPVGQVPVNFVSLTNTSNGIVSGLSITPIEGGVYSRVSYVVTVPVSVTATDAGGNLIYGTANINFTQDVVLRVPDNSIFPATVENLASVKGVIGAFDGDTLTASYCAVIITKIIAEVELVIPAYGYLNIRECTEYADNVCTAFLNQTLYPTTLNN